MERKNQTRTGGQTNPSISSKTGGAQSYHSDKAGQPQKSRGYRKPQRFNKNKYDGSGSASILALRSGQRITTHQKPSFQGQPHKKREYIPKRAKLKIIPLGGLNEIGKNMMVFEYEDPLLPGGGDIILVDMGFAFPEDEMYGIDYVLPDTTYLEDKKHKIRGIVITHGHEDHIGGIPYIWPKINAPIFATRLTAGMIEKKVDEFHLLRGKKVSVVDPDETLRLGVFRIEFFRVAHSIPDAIGIIIHSPFGTIVHTGDFKLDPTPIDGKVTDLPKLERISQENGGVLLLLSDSTNAEEPGVTLTEKVIGEAFDRVFNEARGRIIIASFSSLIARIQQVVWSAEKFGRKIAVSGRSMQNNIEVAVKLGYLKIPDGMIIPIKELNKYPDDRIVIVSTGSQGEPSSALVRMASGEHPQIEIKKGDTVLISANPIPGNERSVTNTIDDLLRLGAHVVYDKTMKVHVSGHGCRDELAQMIRTAKPRYFIPVHGEYHQMVAHRELAVNNGVRDDHSIVIEDGNIVEVDDRGVNLSNRRVQTGLVMVDGLGVGDIGNIVLRDRQAMAKDGIFVLIVTVDRQKGELASSPDIISRGFVYMRESEELIFGARAEIKRIFSNHQKNDPFNWKAVKEVLKEEIGTYLYKNTKRRPMVIPVVIEV